MFAGTVIRKNIRIGIPRNDLKIRSSVLKSNPTQTTTLVFFESQITLKVFSTIRGRGNNHLSYVHRTDIERDKCEANKQNTIDVLLNPQESEGFIKSGKPRTLLKSTSK